MSTRTALVTGAAGGIGTAIVERLQGAGLRVITLDAREPADIVADLRGDELPAELLAEVDVCVSNAAIATRSPRHTG